MVRVILFQDIKNSHGEKKEVHNIKNEMSLAYV
jgi:hypothetical protein